MLSQCKDGAQFVMYSTRLSVLRVKEQKFFARFMSNG